jgi:glycosyltransferase involved in cell wall biosynthesis
VTPIKRLAGDLTHREVRLLMVGAPSSVQLDGIACEHLAWSEQAERIALARMDIGVMPLPDNAWTRGKCSYKAIQYMTAGVPVIADDVGTAERTIEGGGYVVKDDDQWTDALFAMAKDATLRGRLGRAGRTRAVANYSVERWAGPLAAVIRGTPDTGTWEALPVDRERDVIDMDDASQRLATRVDREDA